MSKKPKALGVEINPKLVGVLFTENTLDTLRLFCYYTNAEISQFDVPVEGNTANLQALFAGLNLEASCTSLILDEVVQGRVYIQKDTEFWLYTLLKSPGESMPPLNADIGELPWRVIWKSQEVEVLQYGQLGDSEHCFALRSLTTEADAARLMQNSRAFTLPVSVSRIKSYPGFFLKVGNLLLLGVIFTGAMLLAGKILLHKARENAPPPARLVTAGAAPSDCYLLLNHKISGPYPASLVLNMYADGLLSSDALCRSGNSVDWIKPARLTTLK